MRPLAVYWEQLSLSAKPFDVFCHLAGEPGLFFLDSAMESKKLGGFSLIGTHPYFTLSSKADVVRYEREDFAIARTSDPFDELATQLEKFNSPIEEIPVPALGGAVGYFGYDLCHFVEKLPRTVRDDMGFPDIYFAFYDRFLIYDHTEDTWIAGGTDLRNMGMSAFRDEIGAWAAICTRRFSQEPPPLPGDDGKPVSEVELESNFSHDKYIESVKKAKEYIAAGDIFQVNLSQRFEGKTGLSPYALYRRLREVNTAPFAAFLTVGDRAVLSSSPERFLKVQGKQVETRPIKGTRPRVGEAAKDEKASAELLASEKDNAELAMIVDLERNDLGRVCEYGSVNVTETRVLEEYPTVYHLVATVEGRLHEDKNLTDLIRATFPGGSITGAPKIRAMEIIDELEPTARGPYTGAIGYIGYNGTMDINIAIRTMLLMENSVFVQVGGGIVADSDPELEYQETLDKAKAMFDAVAGVVRK
ncbi:MAG: aminodeoxychorismate synthase component I [Planctomycetota bacterium]|jgi:para-aminobenzoate synthetase component 1